MKHFSKHQGFETINALGTRREPFLFAISFDRDDVFVSPLKDLPNGVLYKVYHHRNYTPQAVHKTLHFCPHPIDFKAYAKSLEAVKEHIRMGNTYLLNLTFATPIECNYTLREIFFGAKAKFKLHIPGQFTVFSPEPFVHISNNTISTYPMKGTIEASLPDASTQILSDPKETAEHVMIVDLMRNDLGMVGTHVCVKKFRYIEKIRAGTKELLQVSSHIQATLPDNWHRSLGTLLYTLLPAGSISGTPKRKTVQIIQEIETYQRGFYTGVFGLYDGKNFYSSVLIRFIQQYHGGLIYKSGGGITIDSDARSEYTELIDKIYIPL